MNEIPTCKYFNEHDRSCGVYTKENPNQEQSVVLCRDVFACRGILEGK